MTKIIFLAISLILVFVFLRYLEKKSLYFPLRTIEVKPDDAGLNYENVSFTTKDGIEISGWFIPAKNPRVSLIFCHGNGGNISHRLEKIMMFNKLNFDVLIFDYRGYGMSKGRPSENGLYLDAEAVYEYMKNEKGASPERIIVYGESLGGAVAVDLASRHETGGIIIEGTFTSVREMAKKIFPFIPTLIYKSRFDSLEKIKAVKTPKLIFHSADDEVVPFELGKALYDAAEEPKEFVEIKGGHNDAFLVSGDIFSHKINEFVKKIEK